MSIKKWPNEDKPSEKLLKKGSNSLTDAELLALFIKTGTKEHSALDIAKQLISTHGNIANLLKTSRNCILAQPGMGISKYLLLQAANELGRRLQPSHHIEKKALNNVNEVQKYLAAKLAHQENEVFACLFLDSHLRLLHFQALFNGTINSAPIYPREILRQALKHNAAKLILAHNHPSGNPQPSQADKDVTIIVQQAVVLFDIELVDHIIIGHGEHYSFATHGLI